MRQIRVPKKFKGGFLFIVAKTDVCSLLTGKYSQNPQAKVNFSGQCTYILCIQFSAIIK